MYIKNIFFFFREGKRRLEEHTKKLKKYLEDSKTVKHECDALQIKIEALLKNKEILKFGRSKKYTFYFKNEEKIEYEKKVAAIMMQKNIRERKSILIKFEEELEE